MRRRWRFALGGGVLLGAVAVVGFLWLMLRPAAPAELVSPGPTGTRISTGAVFGNYLASRMPGRRPAILLLGGSEGGLGHDVLAEARLLQLAGLNVLQLGYFNVPGRQSRLDRVPLERFSAGLDWLKRQPGVDGSSVGVVGYSKGAEAALLVATRYPGIKAVIAGMPSSVAWDALSIRGFVFGTSSWTVAGKSVPSLSYGSGDGKRELLPRFVNALRTVDRYPAAIIPVERYRGALLLVCGGRDTLWPSCPMATQIGSRMKGRGRAAPRLIAYPEAGHGVMGVPLAEGDPDLRKWTVLGGTPRANAAARLDGWPRIVAFLQEALASPSAGAGFRQRR